MGFEARALKEGDSLEDALAVWVRNAPTPSHMPAWVDWHYRRSPLPARALLLFDTDGKAVGAAGLACREFSTPGGLRRVGLCANLFLDKDKRTLGPALVLEKKVLEIGLREYECLYGFPSQAAYAVMKRAGFELLGVRLSYVRPVRPSYYLGQRYPALPRFFGTVTDAALRLIDTVISAVLDSRFVIKELSGVDERFDDLWARCFGKAAIVSRRDSAMLEWRLLRHPLRTFRMFGLFGSVNSTLLAYAAVEEQKAGRWVVFDFLTDPDHATLQHLFRPLSQRARREGARSLNLRFLGPRQLVRALRHVGFRVNREESRHAVLACRSDASKESSLLDPESWYFTMADEDV